MAAPPKSPAFDKAHSGLRKHGDNAGAASLTILEGERVEAFWSVKNADVVQVTRNGAPFGDSADAAKRALELPIQAFDAGEYTFRLTGGWPWVDDSAVELKLTVKPRVAVTKFWGTAEPDDGSKGTDLRIAAGCKVRLHWETIGATKVSVFALPGRSEDHDLAPNGKGSVVVDPRDMPTSYKLVARDAKGQSKAVPAVSVRFHFAPPVASGVKVPPPEFQKALTGLRRHGSKTGGAKLTAGEGEPVDLYWASLNADLVRVLLDGEPVGDPVRAFERIFPLTGLTAGDHAVKLVPGRGAGAEEKFFDANGVDLAITVQPAPAVTRFHAVPEPDDGRIHPPNDLELVAGTKVRLAWETVAARTVRINSGSETKDYDAAKREVVVDPGGKSVEYKIVARDGQLHSKPVRRVSVHFHQPYEKVSPLAEVTPGPAQLEIYRLDETPADGRPPQREVRAGAGDAVKLRWSAAGAKKARLTAKLPDSRKGAAPKPIELALDEHGYGAGVVTIHPGPADTTVYTLEVTKKDGTLAQDRATARVASFNVQLLLEDGSPAAGRDCELTVSPSADEARTFEGKTTAHGELWLDLPNYSPSYAVLRMGGAASWAFTVLPDPALAEHLGGHVKPKGEIQIALGKRATTLRVVSDHPKLRAARLAHRFYLMTRDDLAGWMSSEFWAGRKYLAEWCEGLVKDKKFARHLDKGRIEEFKKKYLETATDLQKQVDEAARRLTDLLDDHELTTVLNGLGYRGACERSVLLQGLGETTAGSAWLEREWEKEDNGILGLIAKGDPESKEKVDLKAEYALIAFEGVEPWFDALAEWAGTLTRLHKEDAVAHFAGKLAERYAVPSPRLLIGVDRIGVAQAGLAHITVERDVDVISQSRLISETRIKISDEAIKGLSRLLTSVNLAAKLNVLASDPSLKNYAATTGALIEVLGTFEGVSKGLDEMAKHLLRPGRAVTEEGLPKAAEVVALRAVEVEARGFGRTALKVFGESAGVLAAVSGLIDAVVGTSEAINEYKNGNFKGAAANAAVAAGGALTVVGVGLMLTGVGAPLGLVLFISGSILSMVGSIAAALWEESELEIWALHCEFGVRVGQDAHADWSGNVAVQIEELQKSLYTVRVRGVLFQSGEARNSTVEIEPSGLTALSRVKVLVKFAGTLENASLSMDPAVYQDAFDAEIVERGDWRDLTWHQPPPVRAGESGAEITYLDPETITVAEDGQVAGGGPARIKTIKLSFPTPRMSGGKWESVYVKVLLDPDGSGTEIERWATLLTWVRTTPMQANVWIAAHEG